MKKFAKILGFLGFFVTVATAQIGTAWAVPERVECPAGTYLPAEGPGVEITGTESCVECQGVIEIDGVREGVFCRGGVFYPPYNIIQGRELCRLGKCDTENNYWTLTPAGATSADACKGECEGGCVKPNSNCPLSNNSDCGYNTHVTKPGTIECHGTCEVQNVPANYCPVTCPTSCNNGTCTCPNDDCTGYDVVNNLPGVHYCGTAANACDVTHLIQGENTSNAQIISANNYQCSAYGDCKVACSHEGNPTCPYPGTTCEWDLNTPVQEGYQQGDDCIDPVNNQPIEPFNCDIIVTGCTDPCQYWNGKECKTYSSTTTYKCGSNTVAGPIDAICGMPYTINRTTDGGSTQIIDTSSCTPSGYRLQGWRLTIDYSPYDQQLFSDPEVPAYNRFDWQATTNNPATFVAEWEEDKLYVYYNRLGGAWVQSNPPADDKEAFTISELPLTKTWTLTRDNSTFRGWCDGLYYSHLSDTTWLNAHCHSPYTIPTGTTNDVYLYAWWECTGPYTLNSDYQCEGDKIDVKYTCRAPENSSYNDTSYTYNNAATYGQEYRPVKSVEDVAEESNPTACQFAGYEIDPDQANTYEWTLLGSTSNSPTDGKYRPGSSMNEWQYISPTPTTEIEFELKSDVWKAKKYSVQYRCGDIKPGADAYTDSSATYGQIYSVAGQFDPIGGNAVTVQDFLDNNCKPNGGFGAWTFQNWTFTCPGANSGPYNTNDPTFGTWIYDSDNCYFTANWAQTDFVIILDSNIDQDPMNNGSDVSDPEELYTRLNYKVYSCPERTNSCEMGSLTAIPTKVVTVTLNGNDGQFTWNNETVSEATDDSKFTFLGFYESEESNSDQYIYGEDDANSGLITNRGKEVGIGYDGTNAPYTWYAHWENRDAVILPEPIERPGFTFNGWLCVHEELVPGVNPTPYNGGDPILNGSFVPEDNATCTAQWTEACYAVTFNENGGTPSDNGTHGNFYKKYNNTVWYSNDACTVVDNNPTVAGHLPTKENATFVGYYDQTPTPNLQIFYGVDGNGALTSDGGSWTVADNTGLFAHYECNFPYHDEGGVCVTCDPGEFYDPNDPTDPCKTCNDILQPITGISGWTSQEPYNWSINQCYHTCDNTCTVVPVVTGQTHQFLPSYEGETVGRQISFYGNEFDEVSANRFNTCTANSDVQNCPQGLLGISGGNGANKKVSAQVDFYMKSDISGSYENKGKRYVVGARNASANGIQIQNGFAWSQVVGSAQKSDVNTIMVGGTPTEYQYTFIIYPATLAPEATPITHYSFGGYGYPENGQTMFVDNSGELTTGSTGNAYDLVSFAQETNAGNMSPIITSGYTRNLYAQYTADPTYTLTYSCGDGGGTPSISPNPVTGIYAGARIVPAQPEGCTNYGNLQFRWWAVSNSTDTHLAGDVGEFEWAYTENKTFTAIWGAANTYNITYLKMPTTNNSITPAGNTLEMPSNQSTSMPDSYTCNASPDTSISGVPRLKNANNEYIGEVVMWCTDSNLETCDLPLELSNAAPCADKDVYAKWECTDPRYHLNENRDDCVVCNAGEYWDEDEGCKSCSLIGAGWTSKPGYNQSIDQCYRICDGSNGTSNVSCVSPDGLPHPSFIMLPIVSGENHQIEFYGNWRNLNNNPELDVCGTNSASVTYCARIIRAPLSTHNADRLMSSKVIFKKKGNTEDAGNRHLVGYTPAVPENPSEISFVTSKNKIWSHIMGPGQYTTGSDGRHYVYAIYPTDMAPSPSVNAASDLLFKGYFDAISANAELRVSHTLGLDSSNAVAFAQSPLNANQIGDRILYPQYCENGQEWDPSANDGAGACIAQAQVYDVKYVCNGGVVETDRATYDQTYTVLNHNNLTGCTAPDGKVFVRWGFSNNGTTPYLADYDDEDDFIWQYTVQQPTFTAQWTDGCYKVTFNNTLFGGQDPLGAAVTFYKKGTNWYAWNDSTCTYPQTPNIYSLPTKQNAEFLGYDEDSISPNEVNFVFVKSGSNAVLTTYGQTWTITGDTTLYAKYDCDDDYTLYGTTCVLDSSNFHTITLDENAGEFYGVASDPNVLYTIEGIAQAYTDSEHNDPFYSLNENGFPRKYAKVTFHYCNGTNNSCDNPSTQNEIKDADFIFNGFYATTPANGQKYINSEGDMLSTGNNAAAAATTDTRWYADWNGYGTLEASRWPVPNQSQTPAGYTFGGWYTAPKCEGTPMSSSTQFTTPDTDLYACWSQNAFTVTYDCGNGQPVDDYTDPVTVGLNGTYTVLANGAVPNGQGGFVTCNLSGQGFNGWKFSGDENTYNGDDQISPWIYGNETMTAQYRTCNSNEVLVNGVCYQTCNKECTQPSSCVCEDATCSYDTTPKPGYMIGGGDQQCRDIDTGAVIGDFTCPLTGVDCNNPYLTCNQNSGQCEDTPNVKWNIKFVCDTDNTTVAEYNVSANSTTELIDVPANTVCTKQGYSFTNWKDFDYIILLAAGSNNVTWPYYHNSVFKPDWNDGNVYHVNLHAYSCDDSSQTGTFGSSGVQNLWEKYNVAWYRTYENGVLSNSLDALTAQQLPTRSGWTFGGYNNLAGDARVRNIGGTWSVSPATLIQNDEDWCAIWSQCNPNEYWNSGDCVSCSTATSGQYPLGDAGATNIYQCYKQCSICTQVCPQTEGVDHCTYGQSTELNGNLYYPGTGTCQPNYEVLCPRTIYCKDGYHLNGEGTACIGDYFQITLDSQRQCIVGGTFGGSDASPSPLYTQFGENGNIWFNSAHNGTPMYHDGIYERLYANPTKTASVTFNGNGGTVIGQATQMANFEFGGFYQVQNGAGSQYINNTTSGTFGGQLQEAGLNAAQQTATNQTWYAKWMGGSIILPSAQREGYPFMGWYKGQYAGAAPAGIAGEPYTPSCDNEILYAQWSSTPDSYNIFYHDDNAQTPLHFYANTGACSPRDYTYGTTTQITCTLTPPTNSHAVFKGWCTNANGTGCSGSSPYFVIGPTETGNKDYYAWWGCESGYNANNGICEPDTSALCPARILPNNAHATFVSGALNSNGTECIYTLKCEACAGCNNNYTCYKNGNSATNGGMFTVTGNIGDANALINARCTPTEYDVYYRCDSNSQGYAAQTKAVYGQAYSVEYNPHNNANGVQLNCQSDNQLFNGWTFNGNNQTYYPGTPNYMINSWNYCNITPIFTASYGPCPAGQIYVPSLGKCRPSCPVPCTWAGYPVNPAQCPTPQYPAGATCWYLEGNPAAQTGYVPEYDPNACLNPMTDATITPQTCNVNPTQDPTCPPHYHWNSGAFSCDPDVYTVTLDPNRESYQNNTIVPGSNNVNELKEKWEYGWSKDGGYQFATDSLILNPNTEVPYWTDGTKVFDGYWTTPSGIGYRMVQANGSVSQNGYQLLPATTITSDTTWYARYVDNPGPFTVTFRCDQDGAILNTQNPSFGDYIDVLTAPQSACTNHPGETFNQWRIVANGMLIPAWYNGTSGMYPWQLHEGSQIVPDWRPVYKVTLDKGATDAVNGNVTSLWDAVGIGWYTNSGLTNGVDSLSDSDLPTRSNYTFAGYVDSVSGNQRGQFGSNNTWVLPETTDLTSNETWRAEWSRCPDYNYYENNQCKECDSNYHQNPRPVTHEDCYTNCQGHCQTTGCTTGQNHVTRCDYIQESYTGFIHWPNPINGQCPNSNGVVPSCDYCVQCEDGWVQDSNNCKQCIEDAHFIVTLNPHLVNNTQESYSSPRVLYTWHGKGVYLYEDYSQYLMNGNQNPLVSNPQTYATVTFNLNGDGAWLDWENQRRTDPVDIDVPLTYLGFYKSETDSDMVINTNRYIEPAGTQAGKTATANLEWHAHWQPRQIGTVTGSQLPQPSRPGFNFVGWFNTPASTGGTQIYASTTVGENMTVYARWSDPVVYKVTLKSNNCQTSSTTLDKLYEKYNIGWSRSPNGEFGEVRLTPDELPLPTDPESQIFLGYFDSMTGDERKIDVDGNVVAEPTYINDTTWYARCGNNPGPFKVRFICDQTDQIVQEYFPVYPNVTSVSAPAASECQRTGYSFTKWKSNHNDQMNAGSSSVWYHNYDADFTPDWVQGNPFHVILDQRDPTEYGSVADLYELYDTGWGTSINGPFNVTYLNGNSLPKKQGFNFGGYENDSGIPMGEFNNGNGRWTLPYSTTVSSDETWHAIWSPCKTGEYWNGEKCYPCPDSFQDNPNANGENQCYMNCQYNCKNTCPPVNQLPEGMASCTPDTSGYPQWGITYLGTQILGCLPQGAYNQQPPLPNCPNDIVCKEGYNLVDGECVEISGKYRIALDSHIYVSGASQGTPADPSTLYTWRYTGVYINEWRRPEDKMTPDYNPLASNTPYKYVKVTLNGNGADFDWNNNHGPSITSNVAVNFTGFYENTSTVRPLIDSRGYITELGQQFGMYYTNGNQTWHAIWGVGSVFLPVIERPGYTFDGWYDQQTNGTRISGGNENVSVSPDQNVTWYAHWGYKPYDVKYDCGTGDGGYSMDSATYGQTYVVKDNDGNFISCSKPGNEIMNTPAAEFTNWQFSGDFHSYSPGQSFVWNFDGPQPTFTAQYRDCVAGEYYQNNKCNACESDYISDPVTATQPVDCYKDCRVQCIKWTSLNQNECPAINEEGVAGCVNAEPLRTYPGIQHQGGDCEYTGPETDDLHCDYHVVCDNGYNPDANLKRCIPLGQYEITLDQNGGTGGQEKLYTIHNIGVYLDPARTWQYEMTPREHPLIDLPTKEVTATFNHCDNDNENCDGANETPVTIGLALNGYYSAQTNGTQYLVPDLETESKLFINNTGMAAGKGYTDNNTWYAHWTPTALTAKWPTNPTRPATSCGVTYRFVDWYTAANGGNVVPSDTPISEDVTWYAHWCEICPTGTINNGSCNAPSCKATFTCDNGYVWDETLCQCVAATGLTLTYDLAGGTAVVPTTYTMTFGQSFTTLGDNDVTKPDQVNCEWITTNDGGGSFPLLDHPYTYDVNSDTTLRAHWVNCRCNPGNGVANCSMSVKNNACVPAFECKDRFVTNDFQVYTCTDDCNPICTVNCTECPEGWISNEDHSQCIQCEAGTYQDGNKCKPCPEGFTSNAGATSCYGNTITIDWDENGGNPINNGSCQYCINDNSQPAWAQCNSADNNLTLAVAPTHSNGAMQFLGWKLFTGDSTYPAGRNVMCTYDNVGVYSGLSDNKIQAQWNECQCNYSDEDHVQSCQPINISGICMCFAKCMPGYELIDEAGTCTPECRAKTSNITYECGEGTGTPEYPADSAIFDANYTVKGRGTCQMTGFNFAGWKLSANNQTYQPGYRFEPWNFTQQNPTFTAQYTNIQCASDEILIGNDCVKCNCTIGTGATSTSCGTLSTNSNTCEWTHPVTCQTGFVTPAWSCMGTGNTNCTASCSVCPENQVEVGGSCVDCECTPDTTTGAVSCGTRSVSNNMCNWGPAICTPGHHNPNITCSGSSNQSCEATCGTCPANTYGPDGLECIQCPDGYTSPAGSTSIEDCYNNPTSYTITYRPGEGMNPQTGNNRPVLQPVTYWAEFTTLMGTTFTKDNHILTRWDLVGDDTSTFDKHQDPDTNQYYAKLHEYYERYNTLGNTILDAHWEQCTCTLGAGAESCGTLSTAGNACNWTNPVCQNGYVSPNMQCSGTGNTNCTLTCGECAEGEIIVDGQCVPCTCTTGTGAASCTPGATANNTCTAVGQCLVGYGNENGNANVVCSDTNCVVSYNECGDGWVSNENCQCNECPANTYQSGNTCVPCQNGYTSPAGSSSADACVPGAHTIHYLSNNGMNETYNQGVYYGQSFRTEGGTRFTYTNHIMTRWNVESGASSTFTNGTATLSGNYVYNDTADTTLSAQWEQCTCDADNCTTYATNSNTCACNATCPTGYTYGGCECDGTVCEPICTLGGSNAVYKCGTGIGTGYSTYVNYGDPHTILTNAFVGCYRDNSTFAGWAFNGDNNIYFDNVGATVTWDYTTDKEFEARWCSNCPVVEHGTNLLTIPEPGLCRCDLTCDTGYHVENGACEPNVYPNENGITYKPNGGTPNRNYTQSVIYDAPFTTLDWSVEHYTKAHHILKRWDVESGGAGTFNGGYADLGREYIYKTDGATVLAADWTECATDEISLNNTCRQCGCTTGTGAASCGTLSTDDDTCTWGPVSCQTGYVTPVLDCLNDTTNCTASCTPCGTTQVEVNGTCTDCVCNVEGDVNGIISGCGFVSNNGNTCNWNPTTCRLGYGNPNLTCTESEHNNNCTASCTICPAGTYGDNGVECKPCPEGKTSLAGATSIRECFIDPNSCGPDEHIEHGECVSNTRACSIPDATSAVRIWNPAIGTYGPCTVQVDGCNSGYHVSGNVCVKDTEACTVEHGHGERDWNGTSWGACGDVVCDPGYEPNSDYTACVECSNRRVNGDIAVSGYIYECEIAACMYQGQKYALQNGECVPICENASDETGTKVWDERTKKCIRTCNPGYKMW